FHTQLIPFQRHWHVARNFRALAGGENGKAITPDDLTPFPISASKGLQATTTLIEAGAWGGQALVVLNPNAGELSLERRWPLENFASLAQQLIQVDGARVVLVGSKGERERVGLLHRMIGEVPVGSCVDLSGHLSIGALVTLLRQADVFVSNDSGPMHVAAAQGVSTLGLFGPETPELYHPIGKRARFLYRPTVCSPCINVHKNKVSTCVMGRAECMTNLTVGYVLAATRDEIGRHGERTAAEAALPRA
ncbi:MAG: ADP-heptose:LPS heptosyltransferase, partial [Planctomycetota bacterium]